MDKDQADEILSKPRKIYGIILIDKDGVKVGQVPVEQLAIIKSPSVTFIYFDYQNSKAYGVSNTSSNFVKDDHAESWLHYFEIPFVVAQNLDRAINRV